MLFSRNANLESCTDNGESPLLVAAWKNSADVVSMLINYGADFQKKDKNGYDVFENARRNSKYGEAVLEVLNKEKIRQKKILAMAEVPDIPEIGQENMADVPHIPEIRRKNIGANMDSFLDSLTRLADVPDIPET